MDIRKHYIILYLDNLFNGIYFDYSLTYGNNYFNRPTLFIDFNNIPNRLNRLGNDIVSILFITYLKNKIYNKFKQNIHKTFIINNSGIVINLKTKIELRNIKIKGLLNV